MLGTSDFTDEIRKVKRVVPDLPILCDADTGFLSIELTVKEFWTAGASGFHIEDQVFPKKCGHLQGKQLISQDDMVEKVHVACDARDRLTDKQFVVCARTDARSVTGIEEAIERGLAYADAGADMLFPEGLHNFKEFNTYSSAIRKRNEKVHLLANLTEFGVTDLQSITIVGLEAAGYSCVIYPVSTLRVSLKAADDLLDTIKIEKTQTGDIPDMYTREQLYKLLDYDPNSTEKWKYKK